MDGTLVAKKYNLMNGGGGGGGTAADTTYDNTTSGLEAENVQAAIDEVASIIGNADSGLVKDVDDLETVVGDSNSGLVADVGALETVVGDNTAGLVKEVSDNATAITALENANKYLTTETLVGKWGSSNLYRKVVNVQELPNNNTEEITLGISGYTLRRLEAYYGADSEAGNLMIYLADMFYNTSTDKLSIHTNTDMTGFAGTIIVEYTK